MCIEFTLHKAHITGQTKERKRGNEQNKKKEGKGRQRSVQKIKGKKRKWDDRKEMSK